MSAQRFKYILASLTLFAATSAFAHAHLQSQLPAADSTVASAKELRLTFTEGVEEKFTRISITSTVDGKTQAPPNVRTAPSDKKVLIVTPAAPLPAGHYQVKWHAVSVDTHTSEGHYSFTVSP